MSETHFLDNINRLMSEYYQACTKLGEDVDSPPFRSEYLAEYADRIAAKLEDEADHFRRQAARWRGEN